MTTPSSLLSAWNDITSVPDAIELDHDIYGLWTVRIDGCEYAIGTDAECDAAVSDNIKESVWAFNAEFLSGHIGNGIPSLHDVLVSGIKALQEKRYEDCNQKILDAITDFPAFVEDAVQTDGRGHFLSPYDSEEIELGKDANGDNIYAYRTN